MIRDRDPEMTVSAMMQLVVDIANWVAPAATMVAAMMTAANLGSRITGWGFVVFLLGSVAWMIVGIANGERGLLITNALLAVVNVIGAWRWLGRLAVHDEGARAAMEASRDVRAPTLFHPGHIAGSPVKDDAGEIVGHVVDVMAECETGLIGYVVVGEGSALALQERLHAVPWKAISVEGEEISLRMNKVELEAMEAISPDAWPVRAAPA